MALEVSPAASTNPLEVVEVGALNERRPATCGPPGHQHPPGLPVGLGRVVGLVEERGLPGATATAEGISRYLSFLAGCGAKVGTMSHRLSGIRFAHKMRVLPDPAAAARVIAVWEGIRRTHGDPAEQAAPLMPPELWDVIDRCPEADGDEADTAASLGEGSAAVSVVGPPWAASRSPPKASTSEFAHAWDDNAATQLGL